MFDTFTEPGGQVAFYSGEPGWIVRSECDLRVGGVWIASDVIVYGGASFAQSLARLGLIDQYRLITHPVALATGAPLFKDLSAPVRLKLVESRTFTSAAVHVYEPA